MSLNSRGKKPRLKNRRQGFIFNSPVVCKLYQPCENMVLLRHFSTWHINHGNISLIKGKAEVLDWKLPNTNDFQHLEEVHYMPNIPWYFNYIIQVAEPLLSFSFWQISETTFSIHFGQYKRSCTVFFYVFIISQPF